MSLSAHAAGSVTEQSVFELSVDVKTLLLKYYHVQADEGNPQLIEELLRQRDLVASEHTNLVTQLDEKYAFAKIIEIKNPDRKTAVCDMCKGSNKDKPILGMEILSGLQMD
ncbi:MAG: hypothetical protein VW274_02370, partial [Thalassolituus sp.]